MDYPPPGLACNGLSRHILGPVKLGLRYSTVPLHAARLWIVRAYRDRPTLTSRPPPAARSRAKGLAAPAARTRLKAFVYRSQHSASEQPRESGGVKAGACRALNQYNKSILVTVRAFHSAEEVLPKTLVLRHVLP